MKKQEYIREYNKQTYRTVKVYIREEEYPKIIEHMEARGYNKISGYLKDLITQDMEKTQENSIHVHDNSGKMIIGDIGGNVNM